MIEKMHKDEEFLEATNTKYLRFHKHKLLKKKTYDIEILNNDCDLLGIVKWHPYWRTYCFFPNNNMLFDTKCLKDIIAYIDQLMEDRKK